MPQDSTVFDEPLNHAAEESLPSRDRPRLPTRTPLTEFPFRDLGWRDFERLCQDIARVHGFTDVHGPGGSGQAQDGVDFTGHSPKGTRTAFQVKQRGKLTAGELETAVSLYTEGPIVARTDEFVVCMSIEANDRKLQDKLHELNQQHSFPIRLWDAVELTHRLRDKEKLISDYFDLPRIEVHFDTSPERSRLLDSEALLLGPVEALGITERVEEAGRLAQTSPEEAAKAYRVIADELRKRFPAYADRFDLLQAKSLKNAGNPAASHDVLMKLAIRDLIERAEPKPSSEVSLEFDELHDDVDETRQVHEAALRSFVQWHERPQALEDLARWFDALEPDDEYTPVIAMLVAEAAVADRKFRIVLDRVESLRRAGENGNRKTALRVSLALADAGVEGDRAHLTRQAEELRLPEQERAYVLLRTARWSAWEGEVKRAEQLYRLAMKFAADANLDLDVEKALWSLTVLYPIERHEERAETYRTALTIQGSRSYVTTNPRTREHVYRHLANQQLSNAHRWSRYRLLEAIRSGSLADELESRAHLARVYGESDEPLAALEQGLLGGDNQRVKDLSSQLNAWPDFLTDMVDSPAPWVQATALTALEQLGDFAPISVARELTHDLVERLEAPSTDVIDRPEIFRALQAVVIEATEDDLKCLMPLLEQAAPRDLAPYRPTDPGVGIVAARLYRFRPAFRSGASSVLAEMAAGRLVHHWIQALNECGNDLDELIATFERVAEREGSDLTASLSHLGHLNAATRKLWSDRLQFVEQYPLEKHSQYSFPSRYDISKQFLKEQEVEVVDQYVQKLVAIGSNHHEPTWSRAAALNSAATAVELLSTERKRELSGIVRPMTKPEMRVSELDEYHASTLHPLSRFRIAFGTVANVQAAALLFLAQSATEQEDCSNVREIALQWLWAESEELQRVGAGVLTMSHLSSPDVRIVDLVGHSNPWVREAAAAMLSMQQNPDQELLERLAFDANRLVRIQVVYALEQLRDVTPEVAECIGARLLDDQSAIVRALTAQALASASQQGC
ncbi:MAG: HEAT repeat domain-containing protein [Caldilineaceae bacterium SB0661_bin_34]|nr:HEAT repeat domain-containing protein [Caldilineaceae bacterium SB0661_bin_34]